MTIRWIGLDADDTLWHSEDLFQQTEHEFAAMMARYAPAVDGRAAFTATERSHVAIFGYGVKGFTLSMIECAIEVSGGRISIEDLRWILDRGKRLLTRPVELLSGVAETVPQLAAVRPLLLITKGDSHHQEMKIEASGLAHHFTAVEVVAEKDARTYMKILDRHGIDPADFLMVGNSVRSDIAPILELGGRGAHIPYHVTWALEHHDPQVLRDEHGLAFWEVEDITQIVDLLAAHPSG